MSPSVPATAWLAAVLVGLGVLLVWPRSASTRPRERPPAARAQRALLLTLRPVLTPLGFMAGWAFFGGIVGVVLGLVGAGVVWVVLGRTEDPAARRRRERLAQELPVGVDLLAACLVAGAAPEQALGAVGMALGGPVGEEFLLIHHRLSVGVDPSQVWREIARHPQLGPLGRTIDRAHLTGASISEGVRALAFELRATARTEVETRARAVEVKAAAPLGVCLLPAFVLLGVVPMVVGIFSSMELFG